MSASFTRCLIVATAFSGASAAIARGDTLLVPTQFATIQAAIDTAQPGDEVVLADGTYTGPGNRDLDFGGKDIAVRSASADAAACIIDCQGSASDPHRAFYFHNGETSAARVAGLTISGGYVTVASPGDAYGGGVYCTDGSAPTIDHCVFRANFAKTHSGSTGYGGGLYCYSGDLTVVNCTFTGNNAFYGGAMCLHGGKPKITDCVISGNTSLLGGAGIFTNASTATILRCMITGNSAGGPAGGVGFWHGTPALTQCTITGNSADNGGGVTCFYTNAVVSRCTISENLANGGQQGGGGIQVLDCSPTISRCAIFRNRSGSYGGGVNATGDAAPLVTRCAIHHNTAKSGGGLAGAFRGEPLVVDCTISSNVAAEGGAFYGSGSLKHCTVSNNIAHYNGGAVSTLSYHDWPISNCILWGNTPEEIYPSDTDLVVTNSAIAGGWAGSGNIDADPGFALPGDFHLLPGSPCIDAGRTDPPNGLPTTDLDGNPRALDGNGDGSALPDMGAYELNSAVPSIASDPVMVDFYAPVGGPDPADQILFLRNCGGGALQWQIGGAPVWLTVIPSSGTSTGEVDAVTLIVETNGLDHGKYLAQLEIADPQAANTPQVVQISLYVSATLHVPAAYATIQAAIDAAVERDVVALADGLHSGPGNRGLDFHGKSITVRSASGARDQCIIDCGGVDRGFRFTLGEAPDAVVRDLTIRNGAPDEQAPGGRSYGGGVYYTNSEPTLVNCVISGCTANYGGGVYGEYATPSLINCMIRGNTASSGAGAYSWQAHFTLIGCALIGNSAFDRGGGIECNSRSSATVVQCVISSNVADGGGGGLHCASGTPLLVNSILWGNVPNPLAVEAPSNPTLTHVDIQGGWPGVGNINSPPLFVRNPNDGGDGWGDDPNTPGDEGANDDYGDLRIRSGSPCIDAGDNAAVPVDGLDLDGDNDIEEPVPFDLAGGSRFVDDPATADCQWAPGTCGEAPIVDIGAYEFVPLCRGDANCDGQIDYFDINPFVVALLQQVYCDGSGANADMNGDRVVDFYDINPFAILLTQNPLPIACE